jgi:hypothetical protein
LILLLLLTFATRSVLLFLPSFRSHPNLILISSRLVSSQFPVSRLGWNQTCGDIVSLLSISTLIFNLVSGSHNFEFGGRLRAAICVGWCEEPARAALRARNAIFVASEFLPNLDYESDLTAPMSVHSFPACGKSFWVYAFSKHRTGF